MAGGFFYIIATVTNAIYYYLISDYLNYYVSRFIYSPNSPLFYIDFYFASLIDIIILGIGIILWKKSSTKLFNKYFIISLVIIIIFEAISIFYLLKQQNSTYLG